MRIAVIGTGHVGLVTAACLASWGHEVAGLDDDAERVGVLQQGGMPFHEPGLAELVAETVAAGTLRFTTSYSEALSDTAVAFVCVGTPSLPGGAPNLSFVEAVGRKVAETATSDLLLVEKSTVPANTGLRLRQTIEREQHIHGNGVHIGVASSPEFLREGQAVTDTLHPDRLVFGVVDEEARWRLEQVYARPIAEGCPYVVTDLPTAELIKHASNAFLATKISFINAVAQVCDRVGANVEQVADGMGLDRRIGREFLHAGLGWGGSCFPKDVDAFVHLSRSVGYDFRLLEEVRAINDDQRRWALDEVRAQLWHLEGKTVTLLGAAFKPGTDDLRAAPAVWLAGALLAEGAEVRIYDPVALGAVKEALPDVTCVSDPMEALRDAHAAVVCTEWPGVAALDPTELASAMIYPIVIDGRNVFDPAAMASAGITYRSVGRPHAA